MDLCTCCYAVGGCSGGSLTRRLAAQEDLEERGLVGGGGRGEPRREAAAVARTAGIDSTCDRRLLQAGAW